MTLNRRSNTEQRFHIIFVTVILDLQRVFETIDYILFKKKNRTAEECIKFLLEVIKYWIFDGLYNKQISSIDLQ